MKYFFGYASGVFLGWIEMLFKEKNVVLSSLDVLQCFIHEDTLLYTLCILDIFSSLIFLIIIPTFHIDSVR